MAACGPHGLQFPSGAGTLLPDTAAVHSAVSAQCGGLRTLTAELGLSGRAGGTRVRGRLVTGFASPDAMRIEAVAPFGPPVFVVATRGGVATLLLPRESAVLSGETPEAVLEALTGVALGPAGLRALLTGCVSETAVTRGTVFPGGWASLDFADGSVMYLRRGGERWSVRGAVRGTWRVEYPSWPGTFPATMRLRSADVDLTLELRQVEANVDLPAEAFTVSPPPGARRVSLDDIRRDHALKESR